MRFAITLSNSTKDSCKDGIAEGSLKYTIDDLSFNFFYHINIFPQGRSYIISLGQDVAVDLKNGQLHGITSYSPYFHWRLKSLCGPPEFVEHPLYIDNYTAMQIGAVHSVTNCNPEGITPWFDPSSGWFLVGAEEIDDCRSIAICFASGCYAVIEGDLIVRIWMLPVNWKDIAKAISLYR